MRHGARALGRRRLWHPRVDLHPDSLPLTGSLPTSRDVPGTGSGKYRVITLIHYTHILLNEKAGWVTPFSTRLPTYLSVQGKHTSMRQRPRRGDELDYTVQDTSTQHARFALRWPIHLPPEPCKKPERRRRMKRQRIGYPTPAGSIPPRSGERMRGLLSQARGMCKYLLYPDGKG